jgi:dihydropteroate synthase
VLRPIGLVGGRAAGAARAAGALPLAGGPLAFLAVEIAWRTEVGVRRRVASFATLRRRIAGRGEGALAALQAKLDRLARPRAPFAGLPLGRPLLMGVVNVTPDSFSDGRSLATVEEAVRYGISLVDQGADILDVGGESTRPGAAPVSAPEQIRRTREVVAALAQRGLTVSIDTREPAVMAAALGAGARIVNDVGALIAPGATESVRRANASAVIVHMHGSPATMQEAPAYEDAALDVHDRLTELTARCVAAGLSEERLAVDPGIGFGKTGRHNAELLDRLALLHGIGPAVLVGASRKGWVGALEAFPPQERLGGSLAAGLAALDRGAQILRVHDVAETARARIGWLALNAGEG